MFDNPKKELKKLEEQLLAAEQPDDDFERLYEEIYDEFGPEEPEAEEYEEDYPEEEEYYEEEPVYERPMTREEKIRSYNHYNTNFDAESWEEPPAREESIRGLLLACCLLSLGIVGVVAWWMVRFL